MVFAECKLHYVNITFGEPSSAIHEVEIPEPNKCLVKSEFAHFL